MTLQDFMGLGDDGRQEIAALVVVVVGLESFATNDWMIVVIR